MITEDFLPPTVRAAMRLLREAGWVTVTHGLGTYVNPPEDRRETAYSPGLALGFPLFPMTGCTAVVLARVAGHGVGQEG